MGGSLPRGAAEGVLEPDVAVLLPPPSGPTPPLAGGQGEDEHDGTDVEGYVFGGDAPTPSFLPPPDEVDTINGEGARYLRPSPSAGSTRTRA